MLTALVVGWQYAACQKSAFGLQFEFALFAETGEPGGFAFGALAAESLGFGEPTEGLVTGSGSVGGFALTTLGEPLSFTGGEFTFPREPSLRVCCFFRRAFGRGAREFGVGLLRAEPGQLGLRAHGVLLGLERAETMRLGFDPRLPSRLVFPLEGGGLFGCGQTGGAFAIRVPAVGPVAEEAHASNNEEEKDGRANRFHG